MADKRKSRYSWKTPWAFNSFWKMRRTLTERYVYKKLGILERHSSFKKPYRQRSPHKIGELDYSYPGWPVQSPGGGGPLPPGPGGGGVGCAGAQMSCLGGILDCEKGGCDMVACICGIPPYTVEILDDPTSGNAYGEDGIFGKVCVRPSNLEEGYYEIVARITDAVGQTYITRHPLVDCEDYECCVAFTVTGPATCDNNDTWVGTIDPPCPGAETALVANTGGNMDVSAISVSADGTTVTIYNDLSCGAGTLTVTGPNTRDCDPLEEATAVILFEEGGWVSCGTTTCSFGGCTGSCGAGCYWDTDAPVYDNATAAIYPDMSCLMLAGNHNDCCGGFCYSSGCGTGRWPCCQSSAASDPDDCVGQGCVDNRVRHNTMRTWKCV